MVPGNNTTAQKTPASVRGTRTLQAGTRVLLAEDNAVNRLLAVTNLQGFGCEVITANDGAEALETFQKAQQFDLVLMDCLMPVMDGMSATRAIRQWEAQQSVEPTPIIAMTAFVSEEEVAACYEAGMNAHIGKPFTPDELYQLMVGHLRQEMASEDNSTQRPATPSSDERDVRSPILDTDVLAELDTLLDGEVETIITPFLEQLPPLIIQLRQAAAQNDRESLYRITHMLKSSSANVGGMKVAELARSLELTSRTLDDPELVPRVEAFIQALELLAKALTGYFERGAD